MNSTSKGKVAIIGSGLIGKSWAMLFVGADYNVVLYDIEEKQIIDAIVDITERLFTLENSGMLRGRTSAKRQCEMMTGCDNLELCLRDAIYVQECVPESLQVKQSLFMDLDRLSAANTILASSSSAIPSSKFTESLAHRDRCLVAHPINPPYYMPLIELVPSPWTSKDVLEQTRCLMIDLGQSPVTLKKEISGFIQPRIQYAMIMECLKLVEDEVLDVEDADKLVKNGIGLLFSFHGPFEMNHLNCEGGIRGFLALNGNECSTVMSSLTPPVPMSSNSGLMKKIFNSLSEVVPLEHLRQRCQWRNDRLADLGKLRRILNASEELNTLHVQQ